MQDLLNIEFTFEQARYEHAAEQKFMLVRQVRAQPGGLATTVTEGQELPAAGWQQLPERRSCIRRHGGQNTLRNRGKGQSVWKRHRLALIEVRVTVWARAESSQMCGAFARLNRRTVLKIYEP